MSSPLAVWTIFVLTAIGKDKTLKMWKTDCVDMELMKNANVDKIQLDISDKHPLSQ